MKVGDTVGTHLIERKIGIQSAYGFVYQIKNPLNNETFALKVAKETNDPTDIQRFIEENAIMHSLQPNTNIIAPLSNVLQHPPNFQYYIMELADTDLLNHIYNNPNVTFEARINLFKEICLGLKSAHNLQVVHRDLHMGNVLLKDSISKLTDFGRAKSFSSSADFTSSTPCWGYLVRPPEIIFNVWENPSVQSYIPGDIYALGIILFFMFKNSPNIEVGNLNSDIENFLNPYDEPDRATFLQRDNLYKLWLLSPWANNNQFLQVQLLDDYQTNTVNTLLKGLTHIDCTKRYQSVLLLEQDMDLLGL